MAAILQMIFFDLFFYYEDYFILINISLKFIPKGLINNN